MAHDRRVFVSSSLSTLWRLREELDHAAAQVQAIQQRVRTVEQSTHWSSPAMRAFENRVAEWSTVLTDTHGQLAHLHEHVSHAISQQRALCLVGG